MEILIVKTFAVIAAMLIATTLAARKNHAFETPMEFWGLFIATLALVFIIPLTSMPVNFVLALIFAGLMGAIIGPGIKSMMVSYMVRKRLEQQGWTKERLKTATASELAEATSVITFDLEDPANHSLVREWNNIITLAMAGTGAMTLITAAVVAFSSIDFSFMGMALFIALIGLIVMSLLNYFFFKSPAVRLFGSYVGALIFSLFLLYDFNQLEKSVLAGDRSWETAVNMGTSIYIDIINLFMDLLDILSSR
jgi:FtsH-binding integral membrane protein